MGYESGYCKKKKLFLIICILILHGCSPSKDTQLSSSIVSPPNPSPTPKIIIITATPTPTIDPLQRKYSLYNQEYDGRNIDLDEFIVPETDPKDIESILMSIGYYGVWFGCDDSNLDVPLEITSTLRNGREYGIKLIYRIDGYLIYYYYLDDPNTIYSDSIVGGENGETYLDTSENGWFMDMNQTQYAYLMDENKYSEGVNSEYFEEGDSDYIPDDSTYTKDSSITEADIYFAGAQFIDQAIADSSKLKKYIGYPYEIIGKKNAREGLYGPTTVYASFGIKFNGVSQKYTITIKMYYDEWKNKFEYRSCEVSSGYTDW